MLVDTYIKSYQVSATHFCRKHFQRVGYNNKVYIIVTIISYCMHNVCTYPVL